MLVKRADAIVAGNDALLKQTWRKNTRYYADLMGPKCRAAMRHNLLTINKIRRNVMLRCNRPPAFRYVPQIVREKTP
jgi:hypothetical protein